MTSASKNQDKYVCPICGCEKKSKRKMVFHLKYGHPEYYEGMSMKEAEK